MAEEQMPSNVANFVKTIHQDSYRAIDSATKSNLTGRNVFITGASKGIGRAIAIAYAKAGAAAIGLGARSEVLDLEEELREAAKKAGKSEPKVLTVKLDVEDRAMVESAAKKVEADFTRLDILVNNAGSLEPAVRIADSDPDEWWKTWTVNIRGSYLVTRSFLPLMLKGGDKQIVNVSSVGATLLLPGFSAYTTGKLAILRFSECINAEYGDQGVMAFSVHPGAVKTGTAMSMPEEMHGMLTDTPEMAGDTIVCLTQKRQEWLQGRYVSCTWDMPELFAMKDEIVAKDLLKIRMAVG
ncbi:hypothetical protein HO173_012425 [Letharia columbiana]|uniref:Uncharacterized protein n=1 Tax=Letharia columbiana TaxID=112416 RepID=A0A8H6CNB2_9LECA|nr:uncharacterized protein HO173_012425 [Letharia columbiana]KAF6226679.1 hypothetical protein HO173_012425 [Letharia columbiana]